MPQDTHPVKETNERVASLEAKAVNFEKIADKWDQMLVQVTQINSNLTNSISQTEIYQRTSQAELSAHGHRLGAVEDAVTKLTELSKSIPEHDGKIETIQNHIARGNTVWWTLVKIAVVVGLLAGFAASVMTVASMASARHP